MKKIAKGAIVGALSLAAMAVAGGNVFAEPIDTDFIDDNFYACVINNYNATMDTSLTVDDDPSEIDYSMLTSLICPSEEITDVSGIEKMINLTSLDLSNNQLTEIDLSKNLLLTTLNLKDNSLTELDLTENTALATVEADDTVEVTRATEAEATDEEDEKSEKEEEAEAKEEESEEDDAVQECSTISLGDEQVAALKGLLGAYGYDTSKFNADAVKLAAAQMNMCDGASREEMRALFNAMGVTDLSDAELDEYAEQFTEAYIAAQNGASLEEILATQAYAEPTGAVVPNTGVNSEEGMSAAMIVMSLGLVAGGATVFYVTRYGMRRRQELVRFKK